MGVLLPKKLGKESSYMSKIGAIILCRYNSTRLPGKALKKIKGKPILEYIIERLSEVFDHSNIVVATSDEHSDRPIIEYCEKKSVHYFRGSLNNVSHRFLNAALDNEFDYAVRINGDNLFIDIQALRSMLQALEKDNFDFVSNVKGRTFPKGMSIEIIKTKSYKKYFKAFCNEDHFEHVTAYLYENEEELKVFYFYNNRMPEAGGEQLAIDTKDDFDTAKKILTRFAGSHLELRLEDIYKLKKEIDENE